MQEELQPAAHNTYYGFPQAPMLSPLLFLQKIPTKPIQIPLLPMHLNLTFPKVDCTQPPCSQ